MPDFDFSTLITDRGPEDLEALRDLLATPMADWTEAQLAAFNQAISKGAYNYTDLNRVTACMDYLNERLTALGYVTGYHPIIVHPETPPPTPILPEGYTELEYIESSGTQYIDTGFKPDQNTRVTLKINAEANLDDVHIFGARESMSGNAFNVCVTGGLVWRSDYGLNRLEIPNAQIQGPISIDKDKNKCTIDSIQASNPSASFSVSFPAYIFATNTGGSPTTPASISLSECKIYDNGTLIREYLPCKSQNGEVGLYDLISSQFYGNVGTGSFIAGPEVVQTDGPEQPGTAMEPCTWYESDVPTQTQMRRYLDNVLRMREVLELPDDTPDVPEDMNGLTQTEANTIEDVLLVIEAYLVAMQKIVFQSGMAWAISGGSGWYFGK